MFLTQKPAPECLIEWNSSFFPLAPHHPAPITHDCLCIAISPSGRRFGDVMPCGVVISASVPYPSFSGLVLEVSNNDFYFIFFPGFVLRTSSIRGGTLVRLEALLDLLALLSSCIPFRVVSFRLWCNAWRPHAADVARSLGGAHSRVTNSHGQMASHCYTFPCLFIYLCT